MQMVHSWIFPGSQAEQTHGPQQKLLSKLSQGERGLGPVFAMGPHF